ncbi:MAG: YraN family protein, partial [Pseudomonadota bacterium]|nr:YraN family protein [Pseudomonadota bacterium]
ARKKKGPDADNISRRQRAFKQGRRAEAYARWVLRAKGYRVLARNFRHPLGEVDLIVRRDRLLIFVEVKFRADRDTGPYAVSPAQWRRISAGASGFVARHPHYAGPVWRFDLFVVGGNGRFRHNKNFWRP